jgi:menaquinone-dependent protoporphyrinogen IX oxidase
MSNVTQLHSATDATDRYKQGDIARALAEGLKHEGITADIEQVLHDVLFFPEQEHERYGALVAASSVLHNLLNASLD